MWQLLELLKSWYTSRDPWHVWHDQDEGRWHAVSRKWHLSHTSKEGLEDMMDVISLRKKK